MTTSTGAATSRPVVVRYLTSYLLDRAGDGLFYVALGWLATRSSGDLGAAGILAAGSVPRVAMLLFGGALGDRWGLLRTARGTLVARIVLMLAFGLVAVPASPSGVLLACVAAAFGLVDALHSPALTGLSGVLIRGPAAVRAQGLMSGIGNTVEVVAGPAAGLLLVWRGDAVGWVGAALALVALLALPSAHHDAKAAVTGRQASVMVEVRDVLRAALKDPDMRAMLGVFAIANFCASPFVAAGVPLLAGMRGWSAPEYGVVMAAFAAGSVGGASGLALWGHRLAFPPRWSAASMLPGAGLLAVVAIADSSVLAAIAIAGAGATFAAGAGALMGTIKAVTPPEEMGRVMSLVQVSVYSLIPAGLVCFGAVAEGTSASTAGVLFAGVMALGALVALARGRLRNIRIPAPLG